ARRGGGGGLRGGRRRLGGRGRGRCGGGRLGCGRDGWGVVLGDRGGRGEANDERGRQRRHEAGQCACEFHGFISGNGGKGSAQRASWSFSPVRIRTAESMP